ncbi:MAG: hypothetical protein LBK23_09625 [Oscillospiraceae bacterium]|jgi:hypothetical protein|nr:hypothetical protein [Oscillospiraceae bacterium]
MASSKALDFYIASVGNAIADKTLRENITRELSAQLGELLEDELRHRDEEAAARAVTSRMGAAADFARVIVKHVRSFMGFPVMIAATALMLALLILTRLGGAWVRPLPAAGIAVFSVAFAFLWCKVYPRGKGFSPLNFLLGLKLGAAVSGLGCALILWRLEFVPIGLSSLPRLTDSAEIVILLPPLTFGIIIYLLASCIRLPHARPIKEREAVKAAIRSLRNDRLI